MNIDFVLHSPFHNGGLGIPQKLPPLYEQAVEPNQILRTSAMNFLS